MDLSLVLASVLAIIVGGGVGFFVRHAMAMTELRKRQGRADEIINKAKEDANDIKYKARKEAKEIAQEERDKAENEIKKRQNDLRNLEKDLAKREVTLEQKSEQSEKEVQRLKQQEENLEDKRKKIEAEIDRYKSKQTDLANRLSEVSGMSREAAKAELMQAMNDDAKADFAKVYQRLEEEAREGAERNSKKIMSMAIQRFAGEYVAEQTIGSVELPSDDVKGRLIGREGRNIRAFEQICGVDLIIDDTPEMVVISSFNVVRREIAKMTIEKLIADGRIHPAKIEEFYEKSKSEFDRQLRELGEKAQMEIGVHGIHPEILKLVGALNWRTSYTQNQYQHAIESSFLCGTMAAELGLNVKQARRAGLLHDVGKVLDAAAEGSHAVIGANFLKKYGEAPDIVHAVRAHHDDEKPETILAHLVAAAVALSGARPGARKAMMESYVSRLSDIEKIVMDFEGVSSCYAISGGREVRVFVENEKVNDERVSVLARDISKKIESDMSYPGNIKVIVLREIKAVGIAR